MLLVLSGCWDEIEIEERAFVSGLAIDLADEQEDQIMFEMTEQIVVPGGLGTITEPGGGKAFRNLSRTGDSLFDINRKITRQENRKMNVEHLGLIIVSAELAKEEDMLANALDVFVRQEYMRRGILVAIADEKAKHLLDVEAEHIKIPAQYMIEMLENNRSAITKEPARIGDIQEKLLVNRSYMLPLLTILSDNVINYAGGAIIAEDPSRMVGIITDGDAKGRNFIIGRSQQGSVTADVKGERATFEIEEGSSKYKLTNRDKNSLTFQVDINIKANVREYYGSADFYKEEVLKEFEKVLENEIMRLSESAIKKIKDDLQVDVLEFERYLRMYHNKLWEEIKDNWDYGENYFSQSEIRINVNANITEPGTSIRVK